MLGVITACGHVSELTQRPGAIPWVNTVAPIVQPSAPASPEPACSTDQIAGRQGRFGLAAGNVGFDLVFTDTGSTPCGLQGSPSVQLLASDMHAVGSSAPGSGGSQVVLLPGLARAQSGDEPRAGEAVLSIETPNPFCASSAPSFAAVQLSSGTVTVPIDAIRSFATACSGTSFTVFPFTSATPPAQPDPAVVSVAYSVPSYVAAGQTLVYYVILTNVSSQVISFGPTCPGYTESLKMAGINPITARYSLNCGPQPSIAVGQSVTFTMDLAVPSTAVAPNAGDQTGFLNWTLDAPLTSVNGTGPAQVTLTPGP